MTYFDNPPDLTGYSTDDRILLIWNYLYKLVEVANLDLDEIQTDIAALGKGDS
jgi:hypothetical protein